MYVQAMQNLHIETPPAMTGVSRFLESASGWTYDKVRCAGVGLQTQLGGEVHDLSVS
jgi:hypothetical protein